MHRPFSNLVLALSLLSAGSHASACALSDFAGHYLQAYQSRVMIDDCYYQFIDDPDEARTLQLELVALLAADYQQVGYKIGLTDAKSRERFGVSQPLVGVLFKQMLVADDAVIELASSTSLLVELDLLARVGSAAINQADTIEEAARHIDAIIPFIELPDTLFRLDSNNLAALLMAGNVGARWGVTGAPVPVADAQELLEYLPAMKLRLSTDTGEVLRTGTGSQILGHPLNSILFLLKELALRNETLKQGQLLSLGAIGGPVKAEQGRRYTARYSGYGDEEFSVSVTVQ